MDYISLTLQERIIVIFNITRLWEERPINVALTFMFCRGLATNQHSFLLVWHLNWSTDFCSENNLLIYEPPSIAMCIYKKNLNFRLWFRLVSALEANLDHIYNYIDIYFTCCRCQFTTNSIKNIPIR